MTSAAAAKSLQSCSTLCDPMDGSPPGSPVLGFSRQEHWSGLPFPSPGQETLPLKPVGNVLRRKMGLHQVFWGPGCAEAPVGGGSKIHPWWLMDPGVRLPGVKSDSATLCWQCATAAKSLQSCLTLCDPVDGSPPGSPIPGILQARTLERVAISFSGA